MLKVGSSVRYPTAEAGGLVPGAFIPARSAVIKSETIGGLTAALRTMCLHIITVCSVRSAFMPLRCRLKFYLRPCVAEPATLIIKEHAIRIA